MGELNSIFKQVGGFQLLKQYRRAGVLPIVTAELLLLGTSKKSLEIIRLIVQKKIRKKLYKEYSYILKKYDTFTINEHVSSNKVWVCWLQGMENAPLLVQRCYHSLKKHMKDREIIVITEHNMHEYVEFPDYILEKLKNGEITRTFFSDILRLELLIKHGGMWIDATVLCTSDNIPECIYNSDLFLYQILKPGRDGHSITISSWLISAKTNNRILMAAREMIYEYWKKYHYLIDYGLLHIFISIALEYFEEDYKKIPKFSNSVPHILLLDAFEPFNADNYETIKNMTCFHKLSNKRDESLLKLKGTYYDMIVNEGIEE